MKYKNSMSVAAAVAAAFLSAGAARGDVSADELAKLVAEDVNQPVRPGTETGYFWNEIERAFMYPPAFSFEGAKAGVYRYTLIDDRHAQHVFYAATPRESLKAVWPDVPVGMCTLVVDAVDAQTNSLGIVGTRTFWKRAAFKPGAYQPAKRSYAEAAAMFYAFLLKAPYVQYLVKHGVTDPGYLNNSYPTKMNAAIVHAMVHYAGLRPACAEEALKAARAAADYLIASSEKPGTPLAGCPPTYETRPELKTQAAAKFEGQMMMIYPATAAEAYLQLFEATGDGKYRAAAVAIADVYLRMQGADGTWPLMVYLKDGSARSGHRLCPVLIAGFLERVSALTGEGKYRDAADRAIAWEDAGPMKTFNWNGQFEDAGVQPKPYWNLSKHMACDYAIFLVNRFPGDAKRIADARDLLRFSEDLFVYWERPARDDGTCIPQYPKHFNGELNFMNWCVLPGVGEQHGWNVPIDASAAKLIRTYLALYRATKNPLDLAKAKALGDSITRAQFDSGDIPTHWTVRHLNSQSKGRGGWLNCGVATAKALEELAEATKSDAPPPAASPAACAEFGHELKGTAKPWTDKAFLDGGSEFHFAVIGDRTGAERRGFFKKTMSSLNLLRPEFVMSVGDLVDGRGVDEPELRRQWKEVDGFISMLEMPFFYVVGNHDIWTGFDGRTQARQTSIDLWHELRGTNTYYSFTYKGCLFIALDSMEEHEYFPPREPLPQHQLDWAAAEMERHPGARWRFIFMHKPLDWTSDRWLAFERRINKYDYTVFCGDWHNYCTATRHGKKYYVAGTAGGGWDQGKIERDLRYGVTDAVIWVTVTKDGPVVSTVEISGIHGDTIQTCATTRGWIETPLDYPSHLSEPASKYVGEKNTALIPAEVMQGPGYDWHFRHAVILRQGRVFAAGVEKRKEGLKRVVLLGDETASARAADYGKDCAVYDFGFKGDRIENVLWRVQQGTLAGYEPDKVVISVGLHNKGRNTEAEIAAGLAKLEAYVRERCPDAEVVDCRQ